VNRVIQRSLAEQVFHRAVAACDPQRRVADALALMIRHEEPHRERLGIAVGKTALAMARGVGPVSRGLAVTLADDGGDLPGGWRLLIASHPEPDERSVAAGRAVLDLVTSATDEDVVIALISGGASALIEQPRVPLAEFRAITSSLMHAGAPIAELNTVRTALSAIKGGQLAMACRARILTLVASDVVGDRIPVVGSGPTIGPWLEAPASPIDAGVAAEQRRRTAVAILEQHAIAVPATLREPMPAHPVTRDDRAVLVTSIGEFAKWVRLELAASGVRAHRRHDDRIEGEVVTVAEQLAARAKRNRPFVGYGEPTLRVPADHGQGGRAQQLALELAKRLRGTDRSALVAGTDGIDGPPPRHHPAPAGAFIDGTTWDRVVGAGLDPEAALARCDAGTALQAVDALFVCGPTGVNHADIVIVG